MIRFWDTSALIKVYNRVEAGHGRAVRLLHGREGRAVHHATSMIVAVELVNALVRRAGDRALAQAAIEQLAAFAQVEFVERHRDLAIRLAFEGHTRGADTAIAAQAVAVADAGRELTQFVTADRAQAGLVEAEAQRRKLPLRVVFLPA